MTDKSLCRLRPGYLASGPQNAQIVNENVNRYVKMAWLSRFMRLFLGFESLLLRQNVENPAAVMVAGFFVFVIKLGLGIFEWIEIDSAGHGTIERSHAKGGAICEL